jgi:hypothetical protein
MTAPATDAKARRFRPERVKALVDAYTAAGIKPEIVILPDGSIRARPAGDDQADEAEKLERRIRAGVNGGAHP